MAAGRKKMSDPDRRIFDSGVREGRRQMQVVILTYLEQRYMNRQVVRGSTLGKAILEVAADLGKYLKGLNAATGKPAPIRDHGDLSQSVKRALQSTKQEGVDHGDR